MKDARSIGFMRHPRQHSIAGQEPPMQRRNFLQLLAALPFVGKLVPSEPSLEDRLSAAIDRTEFVPPVQGCAESPEMIQSQTEEILAYIRQRHRQMLEEWDRDREEMVDEILYGYEKPVKLPYWVIS
jgi:hypothetical protein